MPFFGGIVFSAGCKDTIASSRTTTELSEIGKWAEAQGGKPSRVIGTEDNDEHGGVLRIDFPGYIGNGRLEEISWDEWYETFRDRNLEFLFHDRTADGKENRFFKFIRKP